VNDMLEAALWAATIKVVMEPIPVQSRNISLSAEFFDDRVSEYLHSTSINQFVKFYTRKEAQTLKLNPDHIIKIAFDDFAVGQVFLYEKEYALVNDSIVMATYVAQSPGVEKPADGTDKPKDSEKPEEQPKDEKPKDSADDKKDEPKDQPKDDKKDEPKEDPKNEEPLPGDDDFEEKIDEKDRVTVCHIPPGNPAAKHTLTISKNALNAHLAHGDVLGSCEDQKGKGNPSDNKGKGKPGGGNGGAQSAFNWRSHLLFNSMVTSFDLANNGYGLGDTVKIYGTVKANYLYSRKTTTSKGTINFQIIEASTNRVLSVEKMPGEYVWVSEWATFNGDERALSPRQLQISKQREQVPPQPQELFTEFTRPIFDQLITKIQEFYKGY